MVNGEEAVQFSTREDLREREFSQIWTEELNDVFADVAPYYDTANNVASLGLFGWFRNSFLSTIDVTSGQKVLDVCAGTNASGIALLQRQPDLEVTAIDRNEAMQEVGLQRAEERGMKIESVIHDVHQLPFPDNHFDIVTIQYASRHLRVLEVFAEVNRVLKPGGYFYHADMLRPGNKIFAKIHYLYLRMCLTVTAWIFGSGTPALNCREYFLEALSNFYSANELSDLLKHLGYVNVSQKTLLGGLLGFHKAAKKQ